MFRRVEHICSDVLNFDEQVVRNNVDIVHDFDYNVYKSEHYCSIKIHYGGIEKCKSGNKKA